MGLFDNAKESAMSGLLNTVMQSDEVQQGLQLATDARNTLVKTANRFDERFAALEKLAIAQAVALSRMELKLNLIYDNLFSEVKPAAEDGLLQLMGDDFPIQQKFDPIPITNVVHETEPTLE